MGSDYLKDLESKSIYIIRESYRRYGDKLGILWSMGKDSTCLLYIARKAFLGSLPIPAIHIDTTFKFKSIYQFRDKYSRAWGLNLIVAKNEAALKEGVSFDKGRFNCCQALKTEALKQVIAKYGFKALLVAIRRDEHNIRAKERYFSRRDKEFHWDYQNQPVELWGQYYKVDGTGVDHLRVHPLLSWRELDVWRYVRKENIPVVDLYFARQGKRYRSIGCECCCQPVDSQADSINKIIREIENTLVPERSGRSQDKEKEYMMQKLRSLGYM